jgi:hypothetical protein
MLIRDSLTVGSQGAIAWLSHPLEAFILLKQQYSFSSHLQRDSLYRDFHDLNFGTFEGSITDFNAKFNGILTRLQFSRAKIDQIDQINQYLRSMEKTFPVWTERLRSFIRNTQAIGQPTDAINLQYLMADILEEYRNPASTTAQNMVNRLNSKHSKKNNSKNSVSPSPQGSGSKSMKKSNQKTNSGNSSSPSNPSTGSKSSRKKRKGGSNL